MFNNALTKDDLEITAEIQSDNQIKYTLTGSEAAGFVNSLQIINIESEDLANKLLTLRQDPESGSPKVVTASFGIEPSIPFHLTNISFSRAAMMKSLTAINNKIHLYSGQIEI